MGGVYHKYLMAAVKVAFRLDVVSGLENDLAAFQADGIWEDPTSFNSVSRKSVV